MKIQRANAQDTVSIRSSLNAIRRAYLAIIIVSRSNVHNLVALSGWAFG